MPILSELLTSLRLYTLLKEDEVVGWHHRLNGHELEQTPGDSGGQGSWNAAVLEITKRVGQDLATKQQQQQYLENKI